jgi:hypothetical protein
MPRTLNVGSTGELAFLTRIAVILACSSMGNWLRTHFCLLELRLPAVCPPVSSRRREGRYSWASVGRWIGHRSHSE